MKSYFKHVRNYDDKGVVSSTGGATLLVCEQRDKVVNVFFTLVSDKDNYCKKTGRGIVSQRMSHGVDMYALREVPVYFGISVIDSLLLYLEHDDELETDTKRGQLLTKLYKVLETQSSECLAPIVQLALRFE